MLCFSFLAGSPGSLGSPGSPGSQKAVEVSDLPDLEAEQRDSDEESEDEPGQKDVTARRLYVDDGVVSPGCISLVHYRRCSPNNNNLYSHMITPWHTTQIKIKRKKKNSESKKEEKTIDRLTPGYT